jgi:hypothetical protein
MRTIKAFFSRKTGAVRIEADGFYGSGCQDATKFLKEALGGQQQEALKDEFFARQEERRDNLVRNVDG